MDFSFAGMVSKDTSRREDIVGINGETSWLMIEDTFSKIVHADVRISKAPPLKFIDQFLSTYKPVECKECFVILDQGGELYGSPKARNIFKKHGYTILPTGAGASHQNPVERYHQTICNAVRAMLIGANLSPKFWPYALMHAVCIFNALPGRHQTQSPIQITTGKKDNFKGLRTWGCRVWVKPPVRRPAKFKSNAKKGIFLGFLPHTTRNLLWYDVTTDKVKIATHCRFDEGFSDLPTESLPPNVQYILRSEEGSRQALTMDTTDTASSTLQFHVHPFASTFVGTIPVPCQSDTCGITTADDSLSHRAYVTAISSTSSASKLNRDLKSTLKKLRGAYITHVDGTPVFSSAQVKEQIKKCQDRGGEFNISFGLEPALDANKLRRAFDDFNLLAPTTSKAEKKKADSDDDGSARHPIGTKVYKFLGSDKFQGHVLC